MSHPSVPQPPPGGSQPPAGGQQPPSGGPQNPWPQNPPGVPQNPYGQPFAQQPYPPNYGQQPYGPPPRQPISESDERMYGMLAYLLSIIAGFISPLIFYLIFKERSDFIHRVSREALNLQITALIVNLAGTVVFFVSLFTVLLIAPPVAVLLWIALFVLVFAYGIAVLVFVIMGAIRANSGQVYKVPLILRLVK